MSPRVKKVVEIEVEVTSRDFVMARLAAARAAARSAIDAIDDAITLFLEPEDDEDASDRKELVEAALEHVGAATRALESAEEMLPQVDPVECEPWDDEGDEESDDDDAEDEEDE